MLECYVGQLQCTDMTSPEYTTVWIPHLWLHNSKGAMVSFVAGTRANHSNSVV